MAGTTFSFLLLLSNLLIPIAILIFAAGFFPYKPFLPGTAKFDESSHEVPQHTPFDRLIFMVVDALRSDFVYSQESAFTFTQR
ncbi:gpi ethanolamine phosphate transferase [Lasallia pustulata]|uniref:Gpi ethanolamine phosphate transferase n=1 Tax=Lasallia pustulata TaxID=136370 RepID=A0A1W5CYB3_9LECA|nr:gpi ethanolamine phosphate transferase [Lasallia pustulata]